jgi:GPH family glycoside/pentoside/hexuronide:cation symporter
MSAEETRTEPAAVAARDRLSFGVLFSYGLPRLGMGAVAVSVALYVAKFGTDVLLIPPAAMAAIHSIARLWDGVSDPMAGYLSDRTRSRLGRRRPWLLASIIPAFLTVVMLWSPPEGLDVWTVTLWMGVAYVLFETAQTIFLVPYGALGVELTPDYHERTRLFGWTHLYSMIGMLIGLWLFHLLNTSEQPRVTARQLAIGAGAFWAITIAYATFRLRERTSYQDRPIPKAAKAFADVFRNRHARLVLLMYGIDTLGAGAIITLTPYITQYVLGDKGLATGLSLAFLLPQTLLVPLWIALARRIDKKTLWLGAMIVMACGFFGQFMFSRDMPVWLALAIPATIGLARGVGEICAPAIKADVIDYDELLTGERKEGSYLALWNMVRKGASALAPFLTLSMLQVSGYVPNVEQNDETLFVLRFFFGGFPCVCFIIGILIFTRYDLSESAHAEIRAELQRREAQRVRERAEPGSRDAAEKG